MSQISLFVDNFGRCCLLLLLLSFLPLFSTLFTVIFIAFQGKIPADGVTNTTEPYEAPRIQTIMTLVTSSLGVLFSLGCLTLNILYRKHR